jgi:hypothetical protein
MILNSFLVSSGVLLLGVLGTCKDPCLGFEFGVQSSFPPRFKNGQAGGWLSTDGELEIWSTGTHYGYDYSAAEGNNWVEVQSNTYATLYRRISVVPQNTVTLTFYHRGRTGVDTMDVFLGKGPENCTTLLASDDHTKWGQYSMKYTVPSDVSSIFINFTAKSSFDNSKSQGNFVDGLVLTSESPPPIDCVVTCDLWKVFMVYVKQTCSPKIPGDVTSGQGSQSRTCTQIPEQNGGKACGNLYFANHSSNSYNTRLPKSYKLRRSLGSLGRLHCSM